MKTKLELYCSAVASVLRIDIEKTRTNRKLKELEADYTNELKKLFNKVLRRWEQDPFLQLADLQGEFDKEVKGLVRIGSTDAYLLGAQYAGRVVKQPHIFLSSTNTNRIGELAKDTEAFFWRQVDAQIKSRESKAFLESERIKLSEDEYQITYDLYRKTNPFLKWYDVDNAIALLINSLAITPLAFGTIDKFGQLKDDLPITETVTVVFVSRRDEKVCPICYQLDYRQSGLEWPEGSPLIIMPGKTVHHRCRCRLMIKIGTDLYNM